MATLARLTLRPLNFAWEGHRVYPPATAGQRTDFLAPVRGRAPLGRRRPPHRWRAGSRCRPPGGDARYSAALQRLPLSGGGGGAVVLVVGGWSASAGNARRPVEATEAGTCPPYAPPDPVLDPIPGPDPDLVPDPVPDPNSVPNPDPDPVSDPDPAPEPTLALGPNPALDPDPDPNLDPSPIPDPHLTLTLTITHTVTLTLALTLTPPLTLPLSLTLSPTLTLAARLGSGCVLRPAPRRQLVASGASVGSADGGRRARERKIRGPHETAYTGGEARVSIATLTSLPLRPSDLVRGRAPSVSTSSQTP